MKNFFNFVLTVSKEIKLKFGIKLKNFNFDSTFVERFI